MEQNKEPRKKPKYTVNKFMTKPRIYNEEGIVHSVNCAWKLTNYIQRNETGPLAYIIHKINSKRIKDLNMRD